MSRPIRRDATRASRRRFLRGAAALGVAGTSAAPSAHATPRRIPIHVRDGGSTRPISPYVYGDNAVGTLEGGAPAAEFARATGVTARRLGGNLTSTYNWVTNFTNSGRDWNQHNGRALARFLGLDEAGVARPGAVIETMHETALAMGAISVATLPLGDFVAADDFGPVAASEAAPSPRWTPVVWREDARAEDPIDPTVADIGHLLRRLVDRYGPAEGGRGVRAYALDNEPALWFETHPRLWPTRIGVDDFIARSIAAARVIKRIDPTALVIGPSFWGVTAFLDFHGAGGWGGRSRYGNVVAAYLDAFRQASENDGVRLLDCLDAHWYPYHHDGDLLGTAEPRLAPALLDAPRTLSEDGFVERSWVGDMAWTLASAGLPLPILPSLQRQIDAWFPATRLSVSEFNFGGPDGLASGLAVADALGRFGREGLWMANHWGALDGWIGEAYRLYRIGAPDDGFGAGSLAVDHDAPERLSVYAALDRSRERLSVIAINKSDAPTTVAISSDRDRTGRRMRAIGFDAERRETSQISEWATVDAEIIEATLPPRSARRFDIV